MAFPIPMLEPVMTATCPSRRSSMVPSFVFALKIPARCLGIRDLGLSRPFSGSERGILGLVMHAAVHFAAQCSAVVPTPSMARHVWAQPAQKHASAPAPQSVLSVAFIHLPLHLR